VEEVEGEIANERAGRRVHQRRGGMRRGRERLEVEREPAPGLVHARIVAKPAG
jgi:hypothetical protein